MADGVQEQIDITVDPEDDVWSTYPMNVHLATTGSGSGFSLQNQKVFAVFIFIGLTIFITILGFMGGREFGVGLLGAVIAFIIGVLVSVFLHAKVFRDKFNEDFESDTKNKILKLFRIRLNDNDRDNTLVHGVELMSFTSGEVFVTLRMEIGNSNTSTEDVTAEFIDKIHKSAHQLHLNVRNFNTPLEWRKSDIHHNHLRRLTKVQDEKLKATLATIDSHQSKVYDNSKVISIHFQFVTKSGNVHGLESLINMVEDWRDDYFFMSSIRSLEWLDKDQTTDAACTFLTIPMLDVTSNLNRKTVKYDVRKLVRVYSRSKFDPSNDVQLEMRAATLRKGKRGDK